MWMRRPVGTAIELLAAVPSIIYGMWGFFVIAPAFATYIQPHIIDTVGELPLIGALFQGPPFGTGIFTAAFILAIMILPFIAATMRDVFEQVPPVYKESAYGLGATTWEVMKGVVIPYTRISVAGRMRPVRRCTMHSGTATDRWCALDHETMTKREKRAAPSGSIHQKNFQARNAASAPKELVRQSLRWSYVACRMASCAASRMRAWEHGAP